LQPTYFKLSSFVIVVMPSNKTNSCLCVNDATKITSIDKLSQHLEKDHCFVFLHMKRCPYTIPFYPIWEDVKKELTKTKDLVLIEIDSDVIWYIKENHKKTYQKLTSYYPEEGANKIYFPTFLFFKNGKQTKLMNRVDARMEETHKPAYEQVLSFAYLCHYRTDDTPKRSKQSRKSSSSKNLHQQISQAFDKLLV